METAQKIESLELKKERIIQQSIMTENALQGLRQQVAGIEGQLIELRLIPQKEDGTKKKPKTS